MSTSTITTNTPPRAPTIAKSLVEALEEEPALGVSDPSDGSVSFKEKDINYIF